MPLGGKKMINFKQRYVALWGVPAASMLILSACGTQAPAPIEIGFKDSEPMYKSSYDEYVEAKQAAEKEPSVLDSYMSSYVEEIAQNYYVQQGDSASSIATRYGVSEGALLAKNNLPNGTILAVGQRITIPSSETDIAPNVTMAEKRPVTYSLTRDTDEGLAKSIPTETKMVERPVVQNSEEALTQEAVQSALSVLNDDSMNRIEPSAGNATPPTKTAVAPTPAPQPQIKHVVKSGENIYRIGLKYGISQFDIMAENDIAKPESLRVGQVLMIPSKGDVNIGAEKSTVVAKPALAKPTPLYDAKQFPYANRSYSGKGLIWPVEGHVVKSFGHGGEGVNNTGINIALAQGAPVLAADDGQVIYADSGLANYGNLILVKHKSGLVTAYAHNDRNLVKRHDKVSKGDVIALMGTSGGVAAPQLHFEVRKNARAINPIQVLPKK